MEEIKITIKPKNLERGGFILIIVVLLILLFVQTFKPCATGAGVATKKTTTTTLEVATTTVAGATTTIAAAGATTTTAAAATTTRTISTTTTTAAILTDLAEAITVEITDINVETEGYADGFAKLKTVSFRVISRYYTDVELEADVYLYDTDDDSDSQNFAIATLTFPTIHSGAIELFTKDINKKFNGAYLEQTLKFKIKPRFETTVIETVTHRFRV